MDFLDTTQCCILKNKGTVPISRHKTSYVGQQPMEKIIFLVVDSHKIKCPDCNAHGTHMSNDEY